MDKPLKPEKGISDPSFFFSLLMIRPILIKEFYENARKRGKNPENSKKEI